MTDQITILQDSISQHFQRNVIAPIIQQRADMQATERGRLRCELGATEPDGTADAILSQKVGAFGGQTLEAVIKSLQQDKRLAAANAKIANLECRVKKLEKRQKLVTWCAKRIRRLMRVRQAEHIGKNL